MDFPALYTKAIQTAFVNIVIEKGVKDTINLQVAADTLKRESLAQYDTVIADCKEALEVIGYDMARAMLNASCVAIAAIAYREGMGN